MALNLSKGDTLNLSKSSDLNLSKDMVFGLGFSGKNGRSLDLDSYIAVLDDTGSPLDFIYFGNLKGAGIKHNGDDIVGGGKSTDPNETIKVNLSKLNPKATQLVIGLFIYANANNLGDVKNAFANLTSNTGNEVCRYDLKAEFPKYNSVVVATVNKSLDGEWDFVAVGKGSKDKYRDIKYKYTSTSSFFGGYRSPSTSQQTQTSSGGFFGKIVRFIYDLID